MGSTLRARAGGVIVQAMTGGAEEPMSRANASEREMGGLKMGLKGVCVLKTLMAEAVKMLAVEISTANTNGDHVSILVRGVGTR